MNLIDVVNRTRTELDEAAVARLVAGVLETERVRGAEMAVQFVGEKRIRDLNREHRGRDEVTDVLSFPLEDAGGDGVAWAEEDEGPPRLLGDVVVCVRRAVHQARQDSLPPAFELSLLLVHGTLHLLGYDHETDAGQMALRQAQVLEGLDWEAVVVATRR